MGAKKRVRKKKGPSGGHGTPSLSSSAPRTLNDVSPLLFRPTGESHDKLPFALPFIGPICLAERASEIGSNGESLPMHGRGLIATRDVSQGECLFVTPSIVSADVAEVRRRYLQEAGDNGGEGADLEQITEDNLVEQVLGLCEILDDEEIQPKENVDRARKLLGAFSAQMNSEEVPTIKNTEKWIEILVGRKCSSCENGIDLGRTTIIDTIRRNAFGPDYHNYDAIAQCWTRKTNAEKCYSRLLGVYPLSAMINHSCCPNAVRVFGQMPPPNSETASEFDNIRGREVMIVHANANIPKGAEVSWSYLPPATPFLARRQSLQSKYGFTCRCLRCLNEEAALNVAEFKQLWVRADGCCSSRGETQQFQRRSAIKDLVSGIETAFSSTKQISNESQRYLRVGYSSLYMEHINMELSLDTDEKIAEVLKLGMQLHFSFASCNNSSTEHLSILHLCYDLSAMLHTRATRKGDPGATTRTLSQLRFWTEQLKKAHMVRYGKLGEDLENVRRVMKQSKLVLRNLDGWYLAKDRFI